MRQVHLHHGCEGEDRSLEVCQGQWVLGIDCLEQKFIKSEARPCWPGGHERRSRYSTATTLRSAARRRSSQFLIPNSQICSPGHEGPLSSHYGFHKYIAGHFWAWIVFRSARTSCTTFDVSRPALKIWTPCIQAYMPHESSGYSSNQPCIV